MAKFFNQCLDNLIQGKLKSILSKVEKMKIESLELINFRAFHGSHKIIFSTDKKKSVNVIVAQTMLAKALSRVNILVLIWRNADRC